MSSASCCDIAINGRFLSRPRTGVDRFAFEVVRSIDELLFELHSASGRLNVELLVPNDGCSIVNPFSCISIRTVPGRRGQCWEQFDLPLAARGALLLNLCNSGPLFFRNQVTVLHDAAPVRVPDSYTRAFRTWYRLMAPCIGRVALRILTVSEFSSREYATPIGFQQKRSVSCPKVENICFGQSRQRTS